MLIVPLAWDLLLIDMLADRHKRKGAMQTSLHTNYPSWADLEGKEGCDRRWNGRWLELLHGIQDA